MTWTVMGVLRLAVTAVPCDNAIFFGGMHKERAVKEQDHGYKVLVPHSETIADLFSDFVRKQELERAELSRAFAAYVLKSLLPIRLPGIEIPEVADLEEIRSMLAERVTEWTRQWKREGLEEGRIEDLGKVRGVLLRNLEGRFGPLPAEIHRTVDAIASIEDLTDFVFRAGAAPSLAALMVGPSEEGR